MRMRSKVHVQLVAHAGVDVASTHASLQEATMKYDFPFIEGNSRIRPISASLEAIHTNVAVPRNIWLCSHVSCCGHAATLGAAGLAFKDIPALSPCLTVKELPPRMRNGSELPSMLVILRNSAKRQMHLASNKGQSHRRVGTEQHRLLWSYAL